MSNSIKSSKYPPKEEYHVDIEAEAKISEDQLDVALASNPDEVTTFTAKQAWALIDPNSLDIDQTNDASPLVKGWFGFIEVANDINLEEHKEIEDPVEHNLEVLSHALYCA